MNREETKLAFVRAAAAVVRAAPFRLRLMEALSVAAGLKVFLFLGRERPLVARFAGISGSRVPAWRYILRYSLQAGRNSIWSGRLFFEAAAGLERYLQVGDHRELDLGLGRGKGAILIGAHYGPKVHFFLFRRSGMDVRHLVGREFPGLRADGGEALFRKNAFFREYRPHLVPRGSEKELVRHLRGGGAVSMAIDFPRMDADSAAAQFFGVRMSFYDFPFRLSLRYGAPVFFYLLERTGEGGYRMRFVPCGPFSTPEEGVAEYASFLQAGIVRAPYPWHSLSSFCKWFPDAGPALERH